MPIEKIIATDNTNSQIAELLETSVLKTHAYEKQFYIVLATLFFYMFIFFDGTWAFNLQSDSIKTLILIGGFFLSIVTFVMYIQVDRYVKERFIYFRVKNNLDIAITSQDHQLVIEQLTANNKIRPTQLLTLQCFSLLPIAQQKLKEVTYNEQCDSLWYATYIANQTSQERLIEEKEQHLLMKISSTLKNSLASLENHLQTSKINWDITYQGFSWWNKLKYADGPDLSKIKKEISHLASLNQKFEKKYSIKIKALEEQYQTNLQRAEQRINENYQLALDYKKIQFNSEQLLEKENPNQLLQAAGWCSAFGLSISLLNDFATSQNVYDALRSVNGNFESMSDADIWWETLWMPAESLIGLASLTKGAYFEQLVANDTGGELFEHFNHPDTDIMIDGIAYQIKATENINYIESVDPSIPVISNSEVAELTESIDSGINHVEINTDVDLALDGGMVDFSDSAADGILVGLGGLGLFSSINGINHAAEKYNNGGDGYQAIEEGIVVAIMGTLKAMVDLCELLYKIIMSAPIRFIGRVLLGIIMIFNKKIEAASKEVNDSIKK